MHLPGVDPRTFWRRRQDCQLRQSPIKLLNRNSENFLYILRNFSSILELLKIAFVIVFAVCYTYNDEILLILENICKCRFQMVYIPQVKQPQPHDIDEEYHCVDISKFVLN